MTDVFPQLVDYHCHLDLYPRCEELFEECAKKNISVVAVTTTPKAWPRNKQLAEPSSSIRVALGLHPQVAEERAAEMPLFERYLTETCFVGEVGLDAGPRFYRSFAAQLKVFEQILKLCSAVGRKILSVHSVRAASHVLRLIDQHVNNDRVVVVLHWFTGSKAEAKRALELGCYFSINQRMLGSPSTRLLVSSLPPERILTETDGPFVEVDGRPARPSDIEMTLKDLAALRGTTAHELRYLVAANARALETQTAIQQNSGA
jgi:TatD DNase family protein